VLKIPLSSQSLFGKPDSVHTGHLNVDPTGKYSFIRAVFPTFYHFNVFTRWRSVVRKVNRTADRCRYVKKKRKQGRTRCV